MRNISNKPILKRIGTPADDDVSKDIANIDTKLGTPTATDIATDLVNIKEDSEEILRYTSAKGVDNWFVDSAIAESGDGRSWATAFKTIQEAEDARDVGDMISIRPGTYDENVNEEGLIISKNGGIFTTTAGSYESVNVINTNESASSAINITGDSNTLFGLFTNQEGVNGFVIEGKDNQLTRCAVSHSDNGFVFKTSANSNTMDDCRVALCVNNSYDISASATFINNSVCAGSLIGFNITGDTFATVIRNSAASDCSTAGYNIDNGATLAALLNCTGSSIINIVDNSSGQSRIVGFQEQSKIDTGNTIQDDLKDLKNNLTKVKEFVLDLSEEAGTYDICEADGDILVEQYSIYVSQTGSTFTSATIQTNDTTPLFLLDDTDGAVGNLTEGKQLFVNNQPLMMMGKHFRIDDGKKLQYTMSGDTGSGEIKLVLKYREISENADII